MNYQSIFKEYDNFDWNNNKQEITTIYKILNLLKTDARFSELNYYILKYTGKILFPIKFLDII